MTGIDVRREKMLEESGSPPRLPQGAQRPSPADDAARLDFPDDSFDLVYAPYVMSVVSDPVAVRSGDAAGLPSRGAFRLPQSLPQLQSVRRARAERLISPLTVYIGFKADLDLPAFLAQADLDPVSIEKVNIPRIWSLVTCTKD